jgi:hypothetical protein
LVGYFAVELDADLIAFRQRFHDSCSFLRIRATFERLYSPRQQNAANSAQSHTRCRDSAALAALTNPS